MNPNLRSREYNSMRYTDSQAIWPHVPYMNNKHARKKSDGKKSLWKQPLKIPSNKYNPVDKKSLHWN